MIVFLSSAGYDTNARSTSERKKQDSLRPQGRVWVRRNPYDFTGCLAHVEITERVSDGAVSSVVGHLMHNDLCRQSVMTRLPAVPLHPHVYEVALTQLESGSRYVIHQSMQSC